ncbi:MAG: N-acetylmuramic acid 6-phosphate etherase [Bacteroidetes bacterium]|nr:MAG: N-acetylmuramic acid 6-phosphate etherase [Bacteroidota bacterium]MBL1145551.1 N-acetylmuramic acid 6-phosphate etherase [Bacteroidota bacterium]NOG58347.1 N-acetylmuramic acid 6-phosphate etherase [Bacteroidota bacterium]
MNKSTTESDSKYNELEKMSAKEILVNINKEDKIVPYVIEKVIPEIAEIIPLIVQRLQEGGRLFYMGAGTSGRLGIVDASECPPTFGVSPDLVVGIIAGGDSAIRKAVEFAEDNTELGWEDLQKHQVSELDFVIGIAASGTTPYVIGAVEKCRANNIKTACIVCNSGSPLAAAVDYPIEAIVGPEFVTGSTRMKAGTAQKLILNMISTAVMVRLGRVKGNKMIDMQLSNNKLVKRGIQMLVNELNISYEEARDLLSKYGSVRNAIDNY